MQGNSIHAPLIIGKYHSCSFKFVKCTETVGGTQQEWLHATKWQNLCKIICTCDNFVRVVLSWNKTQVRIKEKNCKYDTD